MVFRHLATFWSVPQKCIRGFKLTTSGQVIGERKTKWCHHGNTPASLDGRDAAAVAAIIPRTQGNVPSLLQPLFHPCTFLPVTCTCTPLRRGIPCVRKPRARVFIIPLAVIYGAEGCRSGYINSVTVRYRNTRRNIVVTSNKSPCILYVHRYETQRVSPRRIFRTLRAVRVFSLVCNYNVTISRVHRAIYMYIWYVDNNQSELCIISRRTWQVF